MGILRQLGMIAVVLMLPVLVLGGIQRGAEPVSPQQGLNLVQQTVTPEKGVLLVASAEMRDPRFYQTVVLLLAHGENGTLGLIINRASEIPLSEVLPELEIPGLESQLLFFGGPVGLNGLLFLMRSDLVPERATQVMEDVYFSGDRALLEELLEQNQDSRDMRVYLGQAGWAPGQLEDELAGGSWGLVRADPSTVFEKDLDDIWLDLSGPPEIPRFIVQGGVKARNLVSICLPFFLYLKQGVEAYAIRGGLVNQVR
jgi:putative transcriptional regulator